MDKATLNALRGSIGHWAENAESEEWYEHAVTAWSCDLCVAFNPYYISHDTIKAGIEAKKIGCTGCPVFEKTGQGYCKDTPYADAAHAHEEWEWQAADTPEREWSAIKFKVHAERMRDFLIDLLPEDKR